MWRLAHEKYSRCSPTSWSVSPPLWWRPKIQFLCEHWSILTISLFCFLHILHTYCTYYSRKKTIQLSLGSVHVHSWIGTDGRFKARMLEHCFSPWYSLLVGSTPIATPTMLQSHTFIALQFPLPRDSDYVSFGMFWSLVYVWSFVVANPTLYSCSTLHFVVQICNAC